MVTCFDFGIHLAEHQRKLITKLSGQTKLFWHVESGLQRPGCTATAPAARPHLAFLNSFVHELWSFAARPTPGPFQIRIAILGNVLA